MSQLEGNISYTRTIQSEPASELELSERVDSILLGADGEFGGREHSKSTPDVQVSRELFPLLHDSREGRPILATFDDDDAFCGFPDCFCGFGVLSFHQERVNERIRGCLDSSLSG